MKTVHLKQRHKEGDTQHLEGSTVPLPDDVANWLISMGGAEAVLSKKSSNPTQSTLGEDNVTL